MNNLKKSRSKNFRQSIISIALSSLCIGAVASPAPSASDCISNGTYTQTSYSNLNVTDHICTQNEPGVSDIDGSLSIGGVKISTYGNYDGWTAHGVDSTNGNDVTVTGIYDVSGAILRRSNIDVSGGDAVSRLVSGEAFGVYATDGNNAIIDTNIAVKGGDGVIGYTGGNTYGVYSSGGKVALENVSISNKSSDVSRNDYAVYADNGSDIYISRGFSYNDIDDTKALNSQGLDNKGHIFVTVGNGLIHFEPKNLINSQLEIDPGLHASLFTIDNDTVANRNIENIAVYFGRSAGVNAFVFDGDTTGTHTLTLTDSDIYANNGNFAYVTHSAADSLRNISLVNSNISGGIQGVNSVNVDLNSTWDSSQNSSINQLSNAGYVGVSGGNVLTAGNIVLDGTSKLYIDANVDGVAAVNTNNASLNGALIFTGFGKGTFSATGLATGFDLLHVNNSVSGGFNGVSIESEDDYIIDGSISRSADGKDYSVTGLSLAWTSNDVNQGTGEFNIRQADTTFNVDVALDDQTATAFASWNGISLSKKGAGTLVLSAGNSYTGSTTVNSGTLKFGVNDSILYSSNVIVDGGVVDLNGHDQIFNQLSSTNPAASDGEIKLNNATLTVNNDAVNTIYSGTISGKGNLIKTGSGDLVLDGRLRDFSGDTYIDNGTLAIGGGDTDTGFISQVTSSDVNHTIFAISHEAGTRTPLYGATWVTAGNSKLDGLYNAGLVDLQSGTTVSANNILLTGTSTINIMSGAAAIDVTDITLGGTISTNHLGVLGISSKASDANGQNYTVINASGTVTDKGITALPTAEYLFGEKVVHNINPTGIDTVVITAPKLSWTDGGKDYGTGTFTIDDSHTNFNVDVALADQAGPFYSTKTWNGETWDGKTLHKEGIGTLTLSGNLSYTGVTYIDAGTLVLDGSNGGGKLTGNVVGADDTTHLLLRNGGTLTGMIDPTNVDIDASSTWNVTANSDTYNLRNAGTIAFVNNSKTSGHTITVNGDYYGDNGLIKINAIDDNNLLVSDKIIIHGNTDGRTRVAVNNVGNAGLKTADGIEIIQVDGRSHGDFTLQGRAVAGAHEYGIYQGTPTQGNGNWYLRSATENSAATGDAVYRPEAGAYLANQDAANQMFVQTLHERLGESRFSADAVNHPSDGSVWARFSGYSQKNLAAGGQIHSKNTTSFAQIGADIIKIDPSSGQMQAGIMFSAGHSKNSNYVQRNTYRADGNVDGYALGAYGTWYADKDAATKGLYVDGWLQYGSFRNEVKGEALSEQNYDSHNVVVSIESGYAINISGTANNGWFVEPQAQIIYTNYRQDRANEDNGTDVTTNGGNNFTTRFGASAYGMFDLSGAKVKPFIEANWLHDQNHATIAMGSNVDSSNVDGGVPNDRIEVKVGAEAEFAKQWNVYGNVGYQGGSASYRQYQGNIGVKFIW